MTSGPTSRDTYTTPQAVDLQESWPALAPAERFERFCSLPEPVAAALFSALDAHDQAEILQRVSSAEAIS